MKNPPGEVNYRVYWLTWLLLLVLTFGMIMMGTARLPRVPLLLLLLVAMLVKACLIAGYFMHLRFERRTLVVGVAAGLLVTAAVLFLLIAPDGVRILELSLR